MRIKEQKPLLSVDDFISLLKERDKHNTQQPIIIKNKDICSLGKRQIDNVIFKNCNIVSGFSNSTLCNVTFDNCYWTDSCTTDTTFKNVKFQKTVIYNNVRFRNCIFDNFTFKDSILFIYGFLNCTFKNTDFRGQELFFVQPVHLTNANHEKDVDPLVMSEEGRMEDISTYLKSNSWGVHICWYNFKYENCIMDIEGIKKLSTFGKIIDPNYGDFDAGVSDNGLIHLVRANEQVKYHLIASMFLYDCHIVYNDRGKVYMPKPPTTIGEKPNLALFSNTLTTYAKKYPITIVDEKGDSIDPKSITPLGNIEFDKSITSEPAISGFNCREDDPKNTMYSIRTAFYAEQLNAKKDFNQPFTTTKRLIEEDEMGE